MNILLMSVTRSFSWVARDDLVINNRFNGFLVLIETAKAVSERILISRHPAKAGCD